MLLFILLLLNGLLLFTVLLFVSDKIFLSSKVVTFVFKLLRLLAFEFFLEEFIKLFSLFLFNE